MGIDKNKSGFTIAELVVVIGIILVTLPVFFSLFILNLQAQYKILALQEVKRNGDYSLNAISSTIKGSAQKIYSDPQGLSQVCGQNCSGLGTCSSPTAYFRDNKNNLYYYTISAGQIASNSAAISPNPYILTNNKVTVSNLSVSCNRTASYSPAIVSISFKVDQSQITQRHEEKASLNYQTKIKLRNY